MKPHRLHPFARLFTAVLLMLSWLVATNHCAFAMMRPTAAAGAMHARCHSCPAPAKQAPMNGTRECCQAIKGAPVPEKAGEKFESQVALELFALLPALVLPSPDPAPDVLVFDHGPPRAVSFAESVLQRSLFSHAPPVAV